MAICTSEGLLGESKAICDVPCESNTECRKVDEELVCDDQFCRGPKLESNEQAKIDGGDETNDADVNSPDNSDAKGIEGIVQPQVDSAIEPPDSYDASRDRVTITNKICSGGLDGWCEEETCESCNTDTRCGVDCTDCTVDGIWSCLLRGLRGM